MRTTATARQTLLAVTAALAVGCASATATRERQLQVRRDAWAAERLTSYEYDYQLGQGWFINFSGRWIHLVVREDTVRSATDVATGQPMPEPLAIWPTIDRLFDEAQQAAASGTLTAIRYDPQLGYPTEIDLSGPPDASGSILASNLTPTR